MSMLWIALAAQLSLPAAVGPLHPMFSPDDVPAYLESQGANLWIVLVRVTFRPDGTVESCTAERSSGDRNLDARTCAIIFSRAKFGPGLWIDRSPAYVVMRKPVAWAIGRPPASKSEMDKANPPDMHLTLDQLPTGAARRTDLSLVIAVEDSGRVAACDDWPKSSAGDRRKVSPELVQIACQHMMSDFKASPARDSTGKPVRSLQNASVVITGKK